MRGQAPFAHITWGGLLNSEGELHNANKTKSCKYILITIIIRSRFTFIHVMHAAYIFCKLVGKFMHNVYESKTRTIGQNVP